MIVWRVRGKIIRSVLCSIVCNSCAQCNAHTYKTDLTVVYWLDLAFLWLYCVLQFIFVRLSFLGLFCVIVHLCICAFVVLDLVLQYYAKRWARKNVFEMTYFVLSGT